MGSRVGNVDFIEGLRESKPVGNVLCGVPARLVVPRNGTEAVPYRNLRRFEFPDTLNLTETLETTAIASQQTD
jgi:hypothetical protein